MGTAKVHCGSSLGAFSLTPLVGALGGATTVCHVARLFLLLLCVARAAAHDEDYERNAASCGPEVEAYLKQHPGLSVVSMKNTDDFPMESDPAQGHVLFGFSDGSAMQFGCYVTEWSKLTKKYRLGVLVASSPQPPPLVPCSQVVAGYLLANPNVTLVSLLVPQPDGQVRDRWEIETEAVYSSGTRQVLQCDENELRQLERLHRLNSHVAWADDRWLNSATCLDVVQLLVGANSGLRVVALENVGGFDDLAHTGKVRIYFSNGVVRQEACNREQFDKLRTEHGLTRQKIAK